MQTTLIWTRKEYENKKKTIFVRFTYALIAQHISMLEWNRCGQVSDKCACVVVANTQAVIHQIKYGRPSVAQMDL